MSEQRYDIIDAAEDAAKVGYAVGTFVSRAFYQISNIEALKNGYDAYNIERFAQRLEMFNQEHEKLTIEEKKEFYDELKFNKQNQNYLYDFVEKARTTTYEIHSQIYAVLSKRLVKNKGLNYYEDLILSNLYLLNEEDLRYLGFILYVKDKHSYYTDNFTEEKSEIKLIPMIIDKRNNNGRLKLQRKITFTVHTYEHYMTYKKCLQFGVFDEVREKDTSGYVESNNLALSNRKINVTECTKIFAEILEEVL